MKPVVSIVMPVYNGEKHIRTTIESVLSQSFRDFEFIIINDGSTDSTAAILGKQELLDPRIRVIVNSSNIGLTRSLNKGLTAAKGDYIARVDAGDRWESNKLRTQIAYLREHPTVVVLGTQATLNDNNGLKVSETCYPTTGDGIRSWLLNGANPFMHSTVIYRRGISYDERFCHAEDFELWTRLYFQGELRNLDAPLVHYLVSTNSISCKNRPQQIYLANLLAERFFDALKKGSIDIDGYFPKKVLSSNSLFSRLNFFGNRIRKERPAIGALIVAFSFMFYPELFYYKIRQYIRCSAAQINGSDRGCVT